MKKLKLFLAIACIVLMASCNEESTPIIDTEEAADLVGSSLATNSSGVNAVAADVAEAANNGVENAGGRVQTCGVEETASYTRTSPGGSDITYDYSLSYSYLLSCTNANIPETFSADLDYSGVFESTRVKSDNTGAAELEVGTLEGSFTTFEINGTFTRNGSFESKVQNKTNSTSSIEFTLSKLTVSKSTQQITGGTATVTVTGSVSGKGDFSKTATVTFLGNLQGEIAIDGTTYSVNLTTGEITKK